MRKIISILSILFLISCSPTQKTIISAKKTLKGNWSLNNISYDRSGVFDVTLYNDASATCFTGSIWKFIPNNNTGTYQINSDQCVSTGDRNFRFTIPEPSADGNFSFLFKPLDAKKKSTNNNKGYRMSLTHLDDNAMIWTQTVSLEGKPFTITMNFNKYQ